MRYREPGSVKLILSGKCTAVRLIVDEDKPCPYEPDRVYAVQLWRNARVDDTELRRWKWCTMTHVRVLSVTQCDLRDATAQDAEREGHRSRRDMFVALGYFEHVQTPVLTWVVEFERDIEHHPRFLHKDSSHGYTTREHEAMPEEPEAVDADTLAVFAVENHAADASRERKRRERWEAQQLSLRLAALEREADRHGLHREMARVRSAIEHAERKVVQRAGNTQVLAA